MKNIIVATITAASLIAPTATFAQAVSLDFPTFYPEFSEKTALPVTKLDINTENQTVVIPTESVEQK